MSAAVRYIPMLMEGFKKLYPDIDIRFVQHSVEDVDNWDICIMASRTELNISNYIPMLQEELMLAIPKGHPLFNRDTMELRETANDPFISMRKDYVLGELLTFYCKITGFVPNMVIETDNQTTVWELLEQGFGLALIPRVSWRERESDIVRLVHIINPICTRQLGIQWSEKGPISKSAALFRDFTIDFFKNLLGNYEMYSIPIGAKRT